MVKEIRVYFEGDDALRPGFRKFLGQLAEQARSQQCRFELIATDGTPVDDYRNGVRANPQAWNILLLDSEEAIEVPLPDFCQRRKLAGLSDSVFWMVQIMESWFLADAESVGRYYSDDDEFRQNALTCDRNVERIPKADVYSKLRAATRKTRKGEYREKTKLIHSPHLLAGLDPERVKTAATNCDRLFQTVLKRLAEK